MQESCARDSSSDLGEFRHFMLKEIFEQPQAISNTLEGRLGADQVLSCIQGADAQSLLQQVEAIQFIACGTSYHAGLIGRHWIEELTGIPCGIEVASEYRYRRQPARNNLLVVTISQSGETADTLAALDKVKSSGQCLATLAVCNVAESSLVRESDLSLMTLAGPEIGVASTKAFTTQLVALQLLAGLLLQAKGGDVKLAKKLAGDLQQLPDLVEQVLKLNGTVEHLAERFLEKHHALYLGRW
ncbi:MAG: SIS domain-containing protein [Thiolinea sp.]